MTLKEKFEYFSRNLMVTVEQILNMLKPMPKNVTTATLLYLL